MSKKKAPIRKGLSVAQAQFVQAYFAHGGNATKAYHDVHPNCTRGAASVQGWHTLRTPKVAEAIKEELDKHLAKRTIQADVIIGRVLCEAEGDVTQLFDENGKVLPPHEWPHWMTNCVESLEVREDGTRKVTLASQPRARKLLLELSGKLRSVGESIDHLADAILADRTKHGKDD